MSHVASVSVSNDDPELPVQTGETVGGKYRVERIVGEGAMGLVVEATHLELEQRVALKFLRREARERPDIMARFAREARAAAKIQSDHVARVFDVGQTPDGVPFIVMEFLAGSDLEAILVAGPVPLPVAAEYVIQACEGLTAAHARGVVHRDIKPGNLFITESGGLPQVKLLDFGISKAGIATHLEDVDVSGTTTQIMGSPHYMSPEQIRSTKDVDSRADLWSMGVVLFELLTGELPFASASLAGGRSETPGGEVTAIITKVLYDPPRQATANRPDLPPAIDAVLEQCLKKDPAQRFQTAVDLATALLPFAPKRAADVVERMRGIGRRASGTLPAAESLPPPTPAVSSIHRSARTRVGSSPGAPVAAPRSPLVWVAVAAMSVGIAGVAFSIAMQLRGAPAADGIAPAVPKAGGAAVAPADPPTAAPPPAPVASPAAAVATTASARNGGVVPNVPVATAPHAGPSAPARPVRPLRATTASAPTTTPPSAVDSDIRHER